MMWFARSMKSIADSLKESEESPPPAIEDVTKAFLITMQKVGTNDIGDSAFDLIWQEMPYFVRREIFEAAYQQIVKQGDSK